MPTLSPMKDTIYKNGRVVFFIMAAYLTVTAYFIGKNGFSDGIGG